jgi:hypothetical protein
MKNVEFSKSIEFLNTKFNKIQKQGRDYDTGSITPRTTTKKAVLDEVKISEETFCKYQQNVKGKVDENSNRLKSELETIEYEKQQLQTLIELKSPNSKDYEKIISTVKVKGETIEQHLQKLKLSSQVQINNIKDFGFETIYQEEIADITEIKLLREDTPAVLRYGLDTDSESLRSIVGNSIEKGLLHPFEEALFYKAKDYLQQVDSAENYLQTIEKNIPHPNNVVLVDIFDRSSGLIKEGHSQTHTIALWKKKDNEIVLIDPSKTDFSNHLCKPLQSIFGTNIHSLIVLDDVIYGSGGKETGYSEYNIFMPKPRDCIDIAVKIAFELNEQQKSTLDLQKTSNNAIMQISNQKALAPHMNLIKDIFVRTLQSTNKYTREIALYTLSQGLYINKEAKK